VQLRSIDAEVARVGECAPTLLFPSGFVGDLPEDLFLIHDDATFPPVPLSGCGPSMNPRAGP